MSCLKYAYLPYGATALPQYDQEVFTNLFTQSLSHSVVGTLVRFRHFSNFMYGGTAWLAYCNHTNPRVPTLHATLHTPLCMYLLVASGWWCCNCTYKPIIVGHFFFLFSTTMAHLLFAISHTIITIAVAVAARRDSV